MPTENTIPRKYYRTHDRPDIRRAFEAYLFERTNCRSLTWRPRAGHEEAVPHARYGIDWVNEVNRWRAFQAACAWTESKAVFEIHHIVTGRFSHVRPNV